MDNPPKERKPIHNASSKVSLVVHRMLAPLIDYEVGSFVDLDGDEESSDVNFIDSVRQAQPQAFISRDTFIQFINSLYD